MATDGEWKMRSIDSYLLREPVKEKEIIAYFAGKPVYAGDDYRDEFWCMSPKQLRKLSKVPKWITDSLNKLEDGLSKKESQERIRANMMNAITRDVVAVAAQEKKQVRAKSVLNAIFLRLFGCV